MPRRHGMFGGRLIPTIGFAAAAVLGVIGGITIAATQVSRVELPSRSIMSEPVPYTLHDAEPGGPAGGSAKALRPQAAGTAGYGATTASQNLSVPASPAGTPSVPGPSAEASGAAVTSPQSPKIPQPREAGFPPHPSARPDEDQLGTMVSDARAQAEQLQEAQLRELAEQMEDAMGLAIGLRSR